VRPLFFGGQLLTEDDLRALVDYVVGKNRLHNRMLFGEGVVCGLLVTCDPCDCGKVVVQPGYALDCCGNDIVVECPVTLDINKMVHELRTRMLGADCGDPCADKKDKVKAPIQTPAGTTETGHQGGTPEKHAQEYCLYIRYCEKPSEPVAPYATDDCSPSSCKDTRLKEGYSFELRCREDDVEGPALWKRICQCLGPGSQEDRTTLAEHLLIAKSVFTRISRSVPQALSQAKIQADQSDNTMLTANLIALENKLAEDPEPTALVDLLVEAAGRAARLAIDGEHGAPDWVRLTRDAGQVFSSRSGSGEDLTTVYVQETANYLCSYFSWKNPNPGKEAGAARVSTFSDSEERAIAYDGPVVPKVITVAQRLVAWAYDRLSSNTGRSVTSCNRDKKLAAVGSVSLPNDPVGVNQGTAILGRKGSEVIRLFDQDQLDCACTAINPSCPTCDDQSVLLACFKVRECCVEEICNLERDFVLTGPNVRYWLPIDLVFELAEWLCCPEDCDYELRQELLEKGRRVLPSVCHDLETIQKTIGMNELRRVFESKRRRQLPTTGTIADRLDDTTRELNNLRQSHEDLQRTFERRFEELRGAVAKRERK